MASSYTPLLGLVLPVTGELAGTWGTVWNDSGTSLLDSAVSGTTTLSTDADVTLTTTTGASNQARQAILLCSGARTVLRNITAPAQSKLYVVINSTTGGFGVVIRGVGPTTGVTVANGKTAVVVWNGTDFVEVAPAVATTATNLAGGVAGSLPYQSGASTTTFLGIGTANYVLTSTGTAPTWTLNTGTGSVVRATSPTITTPTITTSATVPLLIGGTGTTSTLTLRSTSGVGTTGADIIFQTGNNGATEAMRVLNNGRVGIGTNAPTAVLQVGSGSITPALASGIAVQALYQPNINFLSPAATAVNATINIGDDVTSSLVVVKYDYTSKELAYNNQAAGGYQTWFTSGTERMRLTNGGNVGIGTNIPDALLTVNTIASFGDGAVGTPSIAHKGDLNTGFWFPAADTIAASTAGSERMRIDTAGLVGIGTASPSSPLTIGTAASIPLLINGQTTGASYISITNTGGTYVAGVNNSAGSAIGSGLAYSALVGTNSATALQLTTNGNARLTVDSAGLVGIGITAPNATLTVARAFNNGLAIVGLTDTGGANNSYLSLYNRSDAWLYATAKNGTGTIRPIRFAINDFGDATTGVSLALETNGNVGIGTTTPTNLLSLGGNAARTIWMERHTTANTAGNNLTLQSGGATSGATDKTGGALLLSSGTATGTGTSIITFLTATAGSTGTVDNAPAERMRINSIGNLLIGGTTPQGSTRVELLGTNDATSTISLYRSDSARRAIVGADYIGSFTNNSFDLFTNSISRLSITGAGVVSIQNLTASQAVFTDASKNLVSNAITGSGSVVMSTSPTLVTPILGTPTSGTLTNCTGLPVATGISGFGTGVATFLATPSSANLAAAVTDETGTGALVFATSPTLVTPNIGAATGTSLAATGGTVLVRAAATQDGVQLQGRAGGTGSWEVAITPTTLTADRTVTLADGNTTLQAGTMAVTGTGLNQFAATTSAQLAGVISDETGTGALVFGTSPTFTTSATAPLVIGGTATTSPLALRSTSGVGTTGADIIFQVGNNGATEAMRVLNSGNLGIGTATPGYPLHLSGTTVGAIRYGAAGNTDTTAGAGAGWAAVHSGISTVLTARSDLSLGQVGTFSNHSLAFYVNTTERMRIDSAGNVLFDKTAANLGSTGIELKPGGFAQFTGNLATTNDLVNFNNINAGNIAYDIAFRQQSTIVGSIRTNSASVSYNTTSDYRLKENVTPIAGALAKVAALKPVTYTWKVDGEYGEGFIAHELQEICPLAVTGEKDAVSEDGKPVHQGIDPSKIIALLTAAIQEQQATITALTTRIAALEAK